MTQVTHQMRQQPNLYEMTGSRELCQKLLRVLRQVHYQEIDRRQKVEDELRASQQLLQRVMDTLPEAIFWKDQDLNYLGCNQNFAHDAGLKEPTELIGKNDYDIMRWTQGEADRVRESDLRVMEANQPELGRLETQLHSNGEQTWIETNKTPLHNKEGQVMGILGTYQDITHRRQADIQLQELNRQLQHQTTELNLTVEALQQSQLHLIQGEKMSALGNLVAGVAHEINNPMGFLSNNLKPAQDYSQSLLGLVDLYQNTFPEPGEVIEETIEAINLDHIRDDFPKLLASMKEGTKRIQDISTSLRTFSRADTAIPVSYDLHEGLDSTLLILKHRLKATDHRPDIQICKQYGNLPKIDCFAGQLNQVFINILANAIDAIDEGNPFSHRDKTRDRGNPAYRLDLRPNNPNQITLRTALTEDAEQVQVFITDTGPGIPVDIQPKIFEQYFTTKTVGKGTGLGLALSHQIITTTHGGRLEVQSQVGCGTEFILTLPRSPIPQNDS